MKMHEGATVLHLRSNRIEANEIKKEAPASFQPFRQRHASPRTRVGNMGRARWAGPNWPDILEGRVVKLAARIKSGPIGPTRIGPQPIRVRARAARLARIFFFNF